MEKIKGFLESEQGKDILIVLIVILVGLGSFELGRLSKIGNSGGIKIEYPPEMVQANAISTTASNPHTTVDKMQISGTQSQEKSFFASSRGKKYYPANCSAGDSIKESNRVWFDSREEAESAGYELSASCQ
ncbi:MAG: hypothetical protein WCT29_01270 [Candidatus Paceibacterota bacterium]|jgi:hypothetical protein